MFRWHHNVCRFAESVEDMAAAGFDFRHFDFDIHRFDIRRFDIRRFDIRHPRFTKDHFNFSSCKVVGIYYNGLKGEHKLSKVTSSYRSTNQAYVGCHFYCSKSCPWILATSSNNKNRFVLPSHTSTTFRHKLIWGNKTIQGHPRGLKHSPGMLLQE